jgi:hypothetical protein
MAFSAVNEIAVHFMYFLRELSGQLAAESAWLTKSDGTAFLG